MIGRRPIEPQHYNDGRTLFRVVGQSMESTVLEGEDFVVDTTQLELEDDGIYLIAIPDGDVTVKRVRHEDGELWLFSDSPDQRKYRPCRFEQGTVVRSRVIASYPQPRRVN